MINITREHFVGRCLLLVSGCELCLVGERDLELKKALAVVASLFGFKLGLFYFEPGMFYF